MTTESTPLPAPAGPTRRVSNSGRAQSPPNAGRRRPHKAAGARVAAAGLGVTTMFGLVAAMGYAQASADATSEALAVPTTNSTPSPSVVVVVRRNPVAPTEDALPDSAPATSTPATAPEAVAAPPPVLLTARPDVRVITPAPTRSASSSGSPAAAAPAPSAPAPAASTSGSS